MGPVFLFQLVAKHSVKALSRTCRRFVCEPKHVGFAVVKQRNKTMSDERLYPFLGVFSRCDYAWRGRPVSKCQRGPVFNPMDFRDDCHDGPVGQAAARVAWARQGSMVAARALPQSFAPRSNRAIQSSWCMTSGPKNRTPGPRRPGFRQRRGPRATDGLYARVLRPCGWWPRPE